jgi:hypothetical protein
MYPAHAAAACPEKMSRAQWSMSPMEYYIILYYIILYYIILYYIILYYIILYYSTAGGAWHMCGCGFNGLALNSRPATGGSSPISQPLPAINTIEHQYR